MLRPLIGVVWLGAPLLLLQGSQAGGSFFALGLVWAHTCQEGSPLLTSHLSLWYIFVIRIGLSS